MILVSLGKLQSTSPATQEELAHDVDVAQQILGAPPNSPFVEVCGPSDSIAWQTHPDALADVLNKRLDRHATKPIPDRDEDKTAGHALNSVKQGIAAAALVEPGGRHWIVVFGCEHDTSGGASEVLINGDAVTHILIRDPALDAYPTRITVDQWVCAICKVSCGKFNDKYVVVGAP
jgi:hypothetical protein